jgi:murein DD-endopeptidase MepM/ murein hydrolase activator NlpD
MFKTILTLAFAGATGAAGYIGGSIYPAPPEWTDTINRQANDLRAKLRLEGADFAQFRELVSDAKFAELKQELNDFAVAAGEVIEVEQDNGTMEEQLDNLALNASDIAPGQPSAPTASAASPAPASAPASAAPSPVPGPAPSAAAPIVQTGFETKLDLCPRMKIENAPAADAQLHVAKYVPVVDVKGVKVATFPSRGACLSSGFGDRGGRLHKGLDYHSETGAPILAAADGTVVEMKYRDDYGNMLVVDHGGGVYTRYAHLASFGRGLAQGVTVRAGDQIGLMGNTAGYQIPMHLHYELLLGDYANPKASFGLAPADPMSFPAAK